MFILFFITNLKAVVQQVGYFNTDGNALEVVVRGNYAYIADGNGLYIVDVTDPTSPDSVSKWLDPTGVLNTVYVDGNYIYTACGRDGVHIIDITNPTSPSLFGAFEGVVIASDVVTSGDYAFCAYENRGLRILDISDKSNPFQAAELDPPGGAAQAIDIDGDYAYVAYTNSGLRVFDISDVINGSPENFDINDLIATVDPGSDANNVKIVGNYAFCSWGAAGIRVLDISDPYNPIEIANKNTPGSAVSCEVVGDYVYVADLAGGLRILDISGLDTITVPIAALPEVEYYPANPNETYNCVFASGSYTYVADMADGLRILGTGDYPTDFQHTFPQQHYELIGIPTNVTNGDAVALFGDDFNGADPGLGRWRMSQWDGTNLKYVRYGEIDNPEGDEDLDPPPMVPGLGYWLVQDDVVNCVLTITVEQNNGVVSQDARYSVPLNPGIEPRSYTQVANPFNYSYDLSATYFSIDGGDPITVGAATGDSYINGNAALWNPVTDEYEYVAWDKTIPSWKGFWIIQTNDAVDVDVLFTPTGFAGSPPRLENDRNTRRDEEEWALELPVMSADGDYRDTHNKVGIKTSSNDSYDPHDAFEFTPMNDAYVHLYFPHSDWDFQPANYSYDFRSIDFDSAKVWDFTIKVRNLPNREFKLTWPNIGDIHYHYFFRLETAEGEIICDLRETEEFEFSSGNSNNQELHYRVVAEYHPEGVEGESVTIPVDFGIISAYPNPFNNAIQIGFNVEIAHEVVLQALDLQGRVIADINQGYYQAGQHKVTWDAQSFQSGLYFIRLQSGSQTSMKKVILIR
jgi:hypothetical protein